MNEKERKRAAKAATQGYTAALALRKVFGGGINPMFTIGALVVMEQYNKVLRNAVRSCGWDPDEAVAEISKDMPNPLDVTVVDMRQFSRLRGEGGAGDAD